MGQAKSRGTFVEVLIGTAEKLTGTPMTWADEPRKLQSIENSSDRDN